MTIEITRLAPGPDVRDFVEFPYRLYSGDAGWAPPLRREEAKRFDPAHNPWFEHAEAVLLTASKDGVVVGRATAHIDHLHLEYHHDGAGFFGCFDVVDDKEVARALLDTAADWCRERGMKTLRGPFSLSINEELGIMVGGHDEPSVMLTPYHRPYAGDLVEAAGFTPVKDIISWNYVHGPLPPRAVKAYEMTMALPEVRIRSVDKRRLDEEMVIVRDIFNDSWHNNWGYVPWTDAEFAKAVEEFRLILDERLALVAEIDGEPVGIAICLPNINEAIRDFDGRLGPLQLAKLLWRIKVRTPHSAKLPLLGLRQSVQRKRRYAGLATAMCVAISHGLGELGIKRVELGWTLEDNHLINAVITRMGSREWKRHRIYERAL